MRRRRSSKERHAALGLTSGGAWLAGPSAATECHSGVLSIHIARYGWLLQHPKGKRGETPILVGSGGDTKSLSGGPRMSLKSQCYLKQSC